MKGATSMLIAMILPLLTYLASPLPSVAAEEEEIITLIETANTPEDHLKISVFYEMQADKMQKKADKHTAMGKAYKNRSKPWPTMAKNCANLANEYKASADEYKSMAAEHEKMAEQSENQ